jgi:hypothetical protein
MKMLGVYHIALFPAADEADFVRHMTGEVFPSTDILQLTRITSGFSHQLLKSPGHLRQFAWNVTVQLVTDAGYDFEQNVERIQGSLEAFGLVIGVDTFTELATDHAD